MLRSISNFDFVAMPATPESYHVSVLRDEVLNLVVPGAGGVVFDGTLGGGGHSEGFLKAYPHVQVIATDLDPDALSFASLRLSGFLGRFRSAQASFSQIAEVLAHFGVSKVDAALLDLGVSSHELDTPERGFSFRMDGPLDMRLGPGIATTAADLVNTAPEEELTRIFREYGEELAARRVAARIVQERAKQPFTRTLQLADCIARVIPKRSQIHPATRCFQAIRIAVNRELDELAAGLEAVSAALAPGARFGVISFHSLEDRVVKHFFRERATEFLDRPEWPAPRPNPKYIFRLITSRPVIPTDAEIERNPRARSAKLRVVERLPYVQ
jgi:16S rRNA (cytosine1402-N4)-methyltransferase